MSNILQEERKKVSFDLNELSTYIFETEENFKKIKEAYEILGNDPILRNDPSIFGKSRIEAFKIYAEKNKRLHELFNLTESNMLSVYSHFHHQLPGSIGILMFLPYLKYLGTEKQVKKWLEPTLRMEVIGTYAQTEMGHGSDVRSLETTATFDANTDEFIIHSPTLTSTKWWPGELGLVANHVVCMAQLIIGEKNYGVHGFIVQIRDLETNKTLPGIEAGDIGEKLGFNTKDNGYLRFEQVRIPRENMLMRYTKVTKHGEYQRKGNEKIAYAIMMQIRNHISNGSWRALSHGLTIAVRYSLVRTQFQDEDGKERPVLDYQIQQDKLFTLLSAAYAMQAGAHRCAQLTTENIKRIEEREDFSLMKDLHATLCGTKAFYSSEAVDGIHQARLACGGHGYSAYSGFVSLWREFSPNTTYEGDNTIMALQTARYLLRCLDKARKGTKLQENVAYLQNFTETLSIQQCPVTRTDDFNLDAISQALRVNSTQLIVSAATSLMQGAKKGGFKESWDKKAGIRLIEAARGHINYFTFRAFADKINKQVTTPALKIVLQRLCMLFGIEKLLSYPLGLTESAYLNAKQFMMLRERKEVLLEQIRPDAVGLVDAFGFTDNTLMSALGRYDGNVYETLMEWVKKYNDWNHFDWTEIWEKNIKALRYIQRPKPKL